MINKKYPLDKIHDIRKLRVDAARAFLLEKKRDVVNAEKQLTAKQEELASHEIRVRDFLNEEYKRIAENEITYKLWSDFRDKKEWMLFEQSRIIDDMNHARQKLETAQMSEKEAFEEYKKRELNVVKLDEHRDIWRKAKNKADRGAEDNGDDT